MKRHVIIDGNNLLYAMHEHAPLPHIGRETLVKIIERWAASRNDDVSLVFDGPTPLGGFAGQMMSDLIDVSFSAPLTADDVIVSMVESAQHPDLVRVITSDRAVAHAARYQRCGHTDATSFVLELFPSSSQSKPKEPKAQVNTKQNRALDTDQWLKEFGYEDQPAPPSQRDIDGRYDV